MTSGGNVSLLQRESLTREEVFGIAWPICLRSFVQAQLSVLCLYHFSAAHPTRLLVTIDFLCPVVLFFFFTLLTLRYLSGCLRGQRLLCP